jgi:GNAT superfamily N-acetyltransferase
MLCRPRWLLPAGLFVAMNAPVPPHFEANRDQFVISTDPARLDVNVIHSFLAERSYWSKGVPLALLERALRHSLCFGVYEDERQVGFARVITDRALSAFLCDVFILESHRGRGLGKWLVSCVMAHPDLQSLRSFTLATEDAHGLYRQFGFKELAEPDKFMQIRRPHAYSTQT